MVPKVFIETKNLTKKFGNSTAVDHVSMNICLGEIKGLIGENGSGKSTISSMISGVYSVTSGEIFVNGRPFAPKNTLDARKAGIQMIVQEIGTINHLTVAENIFLGNEKSFSKHGFVDIDKMNEEAAKALKKIGLTNIDAAKPVDTYNFETRKLIEIAKAVYYDPLLCIVDETTTALSQDGRVLIHKIMKTLKEEGKAVLFISHDIPELMEICDNLTVLRDGSLVTTMDKSEFDESKIKQTMVGRKINDNLYRTDYDSSCKDSVSLEMRNVCFKSLKDINLKLHEGEILGIGGLSGSGIHEIGKLLCGIYSPESGGVLINDEKLKNIRMAIKNKIGYVSKDRDNEALIMNASIKENLILSNLDNMKKNFLIWPKDEKKFAKEQIEGLNIKCSSMNQPVGELSGGNKQKVSFGKWIGNDSRILILDSPTRGVDIGVKTTMYQLIYKLKQEGYSIVIISEELPELIGMSDRIMIIKDGAVSGELKRSKDLNESTVINYMI